MAEQTTIVCDAPGSKRACKQPADTWFIHRPGHDGVLRVDLCAQHARALEPILAAARQADGSPCEPAKQPRHKGITVTSLRTTPRTRALKV